MTVVKWVLDTAILKANIQAESFDKVLQRMGYEYIIIDSNTKFQIPDVDFDDGPIVVYTSLNMAEKLRKRHNWIPGVYLNHKNLSFTGYSSYIPHDWLLNNDCLMTTWKSFSTNKTRFFSIFNTRRVFIKPNSGVKTFTGSTIDINDFDFEINGMNQTTSVLPETIVCVSPYKQIEHEYRFVIVDNKVITGSEYSWDDTVFERLDYESPCIKKCYDLAVKMAKYHWQPDIAYTCDIAITDYGPKIIELNSFSCAGLYMCNYEDVILSVSEAAIKEWNGDISPLA